MVAQLVPTLPSDPRTAPPAALTLLGSDPRTGATGRARATLAATLGLAEQELGLDSRWTQLLQQGVLAQVHVHAWQPRARLEAGDLGLPDQALPGAGALLDLGVKRLLPRALYAALQTAESRLRDCLYARSIRCHWGYFVPVRAYATWRAELQTRQDAFFTLRDRLVADYEDWRAALREEYLPVAHAAYRRASALAGATAGDVASFVAHFLDSILARIPTPDVLTGLFSCRLELQFIPLLSYLQGEGAGQQVVVLGDDPVLRALQQDVLASATASKQELLDGFWRDVVGQLRGLVYDAVTDVLAALNRKPTLGASSARQLRHLLDQVEHLNFYDDAELRAGMAQIRALLDARGERRDSAALAGRLQDLAVVTRATLLDLGLAPRSARTLGIPEQPTPGLVQRARARLLPVADMPAPLAERTLPQPRLLPEGSVDHAL
jgi:hypothetical protein